MSEHPRKQAGIQTDLLSFHDKIGKTTVAPSSRGCPGSQTPSQPGFWVGWKRGSQPSQVLPTP